MKRMRAKYQKNCSARPTITIVTLWDKIFRNFFMNFNNDGRLRC